MSVTDYEARFSELSHHTLMILPTYIEKVWRFVAGLHPSIRGGMTGEVEMGTEYQLVGSSSGYSGQHDSSSAHFSSAPESSYLLPAIQGSSNGYSGQQAQTSGQQAMVPRACYECGDLGHIKRTCPRLRGKAMQQSQQPMISAPTTAQS
uniref:Uncharacterized protein LOC104215110 n=1 Tax=Nicotiana sylvestris TaxID=4096 RepID=A0A1U7VMU9_NICSY|nr:PREDICTED: uncharacterized protein LOC104215110 [Nicotiana sylvestris]